MWAVHYKEQRALVLTFMGQIYFYIGTPGLNIFPDCVSQFNVKA